MKRNIFLTAFFIAMALAIIPAKAQWQKLRGLYIPTSWGYADLLSSASSLDMPKAYGYVSFVISDQEKKFEYWFCEFDNKTGSLIKKIKKLDFKPKASNMMMLKDGVSILGILNGETVKINSITGEYEVITSYPGSEKLFYNHQKNHLVIKYDGSNLLDVYDLNSNTRLTRLRNYEWFTGGLYRIKGSSQAKYLATIDSVEKTDLGQTWYSCFLMDASNLSVIDTIQAIKVPIGTTVNCKYKDIAFSDDESKFAVLDSAYNLRVYSLPDMKLITTHPIQNQLKNVVSMCFDSSGQNIIYSNYENSVLINTETWYENIFESNKEVNCENRIYGTNYFNVYIHLYYLDLKIAEIEHLEPLFKLAVNKSSIQIQSEIGVSEAQIISIDGKVLIENQYDNEQNIRIPLEVPAGAYIVRVKIGDNYYSQKFIWGE
jgi:hypothetical protein